MREILEKKCIQCGKTYLKPYWISLTNWELRKYCSTECQAKFWKGKPSRRKGKGLGYTPWNKGKKSNKPAWNKGNGEYAKKLGFGKWMLGRKLSEETKRKISEASQEEKGNAWKGDDVGYGGLHMWVYKHLGKPDTCEHCGVEGLKGRAIHWANKSQQYKRDVKDWIRLCVKCHTAYDKQFKKYKRR